MKKTACFLSGAVLAFVLLLTAVLIPALSTQRFQAALVNTVDQQALGVSEGDLSAFAEETMRYLRSEKDAWEPRIPHEGVSEAFRIHMAEVRGWVSAAPWVIGLGVIAGIALLWLGGFLRKQALLGVAALLGVLAVILLWAAVDFASFWMVLHQWFIPGGIFSAHEAVMSLFPLELFFGYIPAVCLWAALLLGALCAGMWFSLKNDQRTKA